MIWFLAPGYYRPSTYMPSTAYMFTTTALPFLLPGQTPTAQPGLVAGMVPSAVPGQLQQVKRTRNFFPETWIWDSVISG